MNYMGSKSRICKYIIPIINNYIKENNIENFYDCFTGGGCVADKILCKNVYANDYACDIIELHKTAQTNFDKIPISCNKEEWNEAKDAYKIVLNLLKNKSYSHFTKEDFNKIGMDLYRIGAIRILASYCSGGFAKGYAKDSKTRKYYNERWRNYKQQSESSNFKKIKFMSSDYKQIKFQPNSVLYCDSPYKGTNSYDIDKNFDFDAYYTWLRETSKIYPIFVSEQNLPEEFDKFLIWQKEHNRTIGVTNNFKVIEKLWLIDDRKD